MMDITTAELVAICKAFHLFSTSKWAGKTSVTFESDYLNVVNWFKEPVATPKFMVLLLVNARKAVVG